MIHKLSDFHYKTSRTGVSPVLKGEMPDSRDGCPTVVLAS